MHYAAHVGTILDNMSTLITIAEIALEMDKNKSTVSRHVAKLGLGIRIGQTIALTPNEARKVRKSIKDAKPGNPNAATARLG